MHECVSVCVIMSLYTCTPIYTPAYNHENDIWTNVHMYIFLFLSLSTCIYIYYIYIYIHIIYIIYFIYYIYYMYSCMHAVVLHAEEGWFWIHRQGMADLLSRVMYGTTCKGSGLPNDAQSRTGLTLPLSLSLSLALALSLSLSSLSLSLSLPPWHSKR